MDKLQFICGISYLLVEIALTVVCSSRPSSAVKMYDVNVFSNSLTTNEATVFFFNIFKVIHDFKFTMTAEILARSLANFHYQ